MRYVVADIHGNYDLLVKLLRKIKFSKDDTLFVLGDVIDKGKDVDKILNLLLVKMENNAIVLAGNHEYDFVKLMTNLIVKDASDEELIDSAKNYLGVSNISIEQIDMIMNMPFYHEEDDFILVHAGVPFDIKGKMIPLEQATIEDLVYDRRFKNENFLPPSTKCVIFGHTPTFYVSGQKGKILKYQKENTVGNNPKDYYKVHIDTGNYLTGILGCLRLDDMQEFYVSEFD
ncbi:MAG: serine/threonine protein phosphatase [Clostridia bacterium]|nr:serine/threonine protein phosphatase [Clostridia bacterium]